MIHPHRSTHPPITTTPLIPIARGPIAFSFKLIGLVFASVIFNVPAFPIGAFAAEPARPNVVVFLVDDMGIMDTSVPFLTDQSGEPKIYPLNEYYRTPNMQRLAKQGIRLNQFYAMSVCSPTRISIMSGQNAARHHATNWINPRQNNRGPLGPLRWDWEGLDSHDVTLPGVLGN